MRKGDRIQTSGEGRTRNWPNCKGTITKRRGDNVFVIWDEICWIEDQMNILEVTLL